MPYSSMGPWCSGGTSYTLLHITHSTLLPCRLNLDARLMYAAHPLHLNGLFLGTGTCSPLLGSVVTVSVVLKSICGTSPLRHSYALLYSA